MTRVGVSPGVSKLSALSQSPRSRRGCRTGFALLLMTAALWMFPTLCSGQQSQTITFTQPPPQQAYAGTSVVLAATATSGLPVTFSVASGPAQVSGVNGSTLTYV